jgi:NAD(P)H-dependent flavin oxidoreductase YrpB (nitropropane dioxygenase family)
MAGGPSMAALATAVTNGGGLGFLAADMLSADELADTTVAARKLTSGALGVNLFVPQDQWPPQQSSLRSRRLWRKRPNGTAWRWVNCVTSTTTGPRNSRWCAIFDRRWCHLRSVRRAKRSAADSAMAQDLKPGGPLHERTEVLPRVPVQRYARSGHKRCASRVGLRDRST